MNQRSAAVILQDSSLTPRKAIEAIDPTDITNVFAKEGTFGTYFKVPFDGTEVYIEPAFQVSVYDVKVYAALSIGAGNEVLVEKLRTDGTLATIANFVAAGGNGEVVPLNPNTIDQLAIDPNIGEAIKITAPLGMTGSCTVRIFFEK